MGIGADLILLRRTDSFQIKPFSDSIAIDLFVSHLICDESNE